MPTAQLPWNVCIDFGTAFSKAAAAPAEAWERFDPAFVRPLALSRAFSSEHPFLLLSAIFVDENRILFGHEATEAAERLVDEKRQALRSIKTLFGAADLKRVLSIHLSAAIDPHRVFRQRDLIILYLAYLLYSLDSALAVDRVFSDAEIKLRFACPSWRGRTDTDVYDIVARLFDEARLVVDAFGAELHAKAGIPLDGALNALSAARDAQSPRRSMSGMVFEAPAAAACSFIGLDRAAKPLIVLDVGAGTTDIAALAPHEGGFVDLALARTTLTQAGDFVDRVLLNILIERMPGKAAERSRDWHALAGQIRQIRKDLFDTGQASVDCQGKSIKVSRQDVERDGDYKVFVGEMQKAYRRSLDVLVERAAADRHTEIYAIAVGGNAQAPFIKDTILAKPTVATKVKVTRLKATPAWAEETGAEFSAIFPQLAIAIGGALAPDYYLAAG